MLNFNLIISLIFSNVSGLIVMNTESTWTDIMISNLPPSSFLYKMQDYAWILVMLHYFIKYLSNSLNHKIAASIFPYTEFNNGIQFYSSNSFVIVPRSSMPSGYLMNISIGISGCINASSASHRLSIARWH